MALGQSMFGNRWLESIGIFRNQCKGPILYKYPTKLQTDGELRTIKTFDKVTAEHDLQLLEPIRPARVLTLSQ
jgi:hypothetical protein